MSRTKGAWLPQKGIHEITIGSTMRRFLGEQEPQQSRGDFVSMQYNYKPVSAANAGGLLTVAGSGTMSPKDTLQLQLKTEAGERHSFRAIPAEAKREVECVIFYDPNTGALVLERLDTILSLTHEGSQSRSHTQPLKNGAQAHPRRPTAFPPTPPSNSPPEYTKLPEQATKYTDIQHGPNTDKQPFPGLKETTSADLSSSANPLRRSPPQTLTDYAQEQHRLKAKGLGPKPTNNFASEPDEELLEFGKPAVPSPNALQLSDVQRRGGKRKYSDSEPDEEELEFGVPTREIKRLKTASPASFTRGSSSPGYQSDKSHSAQYSSPHQQSHLLPPVPLRSSVAAMGTHMVHGSSPLAVSQTIVNSVSDDDDSDSSSDSDDDENEMQAVAPADEDDDDFLAAAFKSDDDVADTGHNGATNQSDDSSDDNSDYDEH